MKTTRLRASPWLDGFNIEAIFQRNNLKALNTALNNYFYMKRMQASASMPTEEKKNKHIKKKKKVAMAAAAATRAKC